MKSLLEGHCTLKKSVFTTDINVCNYTNHIVVVKSIYVVTENVVT